eukprot:TRINITY_DN1256_c0_g1_i1.p1 TRINITY_DN1256_c0_g1~~TRINITY_DN1256_c0_g1_i1.p1  ORF type:complete len:265 (+),score=50.29 TRINITY_DN1256_c0_g1_i1:75-797(+)
MVASQLAFSFVLQGKKVGILDVDLCGPSIPRCLGVENHQVLQSSGGWIPCKVDNLELYVMSIAFLLDDKSSAVVWRGPKKNSMIKQFFEDVLWGDLDYLIIDTPPGTSDEHLSVVELLKDYNPDGAIVVTTPQGVSINDVRKEISFCQKVSLPVLGIVENMSGFVCPHCEECTNIFSSGGGEKLAEQLKIPFIGRIPLDPSIGQTIDLGKSPLLSSSPSSSLKTLTEFARTFCQQNQPGI